MKENLINKVGVK